MKLLRKPSGYWVAVCLLLLGGFLFNGCQTGPQSADPLAEVHDLPPPSAINFSPPPASASTSNNLTSGASSLKHNPTSGASSITLRVGDLLTITYSDVPTLMPPYEGRIKDDGSITIPPYSQMFVAAGKNVRELEQEVRDRYVPIYFVNLTVSITSKDLFYSVDGEVKMPNRQVYLSKMSVLGAIATAGGFTDYAKKKKVQVIRADGKKITVNCVKALQNPELDVEIFPGDKIIVPRRLF